MIKKDIKDPSLPNRGCEGIKCTSNANYQLKLSVQNIGTITLLLCERCLSQFLKDGEKSD
jgi:hypothetical protein